MWGTTVHTQSKVVVSDAKFPWWLSPTKKNWNINWFFLDILIINELCNLIGREAQLATPNQKWKSQVLPSLDDYLHAKKKKKKYKLILSRAIDDKQILQSDWLRGGVGHTWPKKIVSYATFPWWRIPSKKLKISIDSFQRSWWSLNTTTIWLVESIYPLDTGCKLNKNKMFWRCPWYPLNILCTFHLLLCLGG